MSGLKPGSILPADMDPRTWATWCRQQEPTFTQDIDTNIADKTAAINTNNKFMGKVIYDTVNHQLLVARGPTNTDAWDVVDGSASVVPS